CTQRIQAGKLRAEAAGLPLADGDVRTACQQACPAEAIVFGDLAVAENAAGRGVPDPGAKYLRRSRGEILMAAEPLSVRLPWVEGSPSLLQITDDVCRPLATRPSA